MASPADRLFDWQLLYFGTRYRRWMAHTNPLPNEKAAVRRWARNVTRHGPSSFAVPITPSGEDFAEGIDEAHAVVVYAVSDYEELVTLIGLY